jgi:hypothetical protein
MKKLFLILTLSLFIAAFSFTAVPYAGETAPNLATYVVGEWTYYSAIANTKRGSVFFDSAEGGTILDEKFGEGVFKGKFTKKDVYEAELTFPKNDKIKDQVFKTVFKFKKRFDKWGFNASAKSPKHSFKLSNAEKVMGQK